MQSVVVSGAFAAGLEGFSGLCEDGSIVVGEAPGNP